MRMSDGKPFSQACENNKRPIADKLALVFTRAGTVLEIGTGTGQHAVYFARHLPNLTWQPSDHPANHLQCEPWLADENLPNINAPMPLDVSADNWRLPQINGAFSANTAHIMTWTEVEAMFHGVSAHLRQGDFFCLYGPFNYNGHFTAASNQQFDSFLRQRHPGMGIRDIGDLTSMAGECGLTLEQDFEMPANNRLLVWQRR